MVINGMVKTQQMLQVLLWINKMIIILFVVKNHRDHLIEILNMIVVKISHQQQLIVKYKMTNLILIQKLLIQIYLILLMIKILCFYLI